jgi:hypothetical protein
MGRLLYLNPICHHTDAQERMISPAPRRAERLVALAATLLSFSLTAWLCGNAYEEIVIVPNFAFGDVRVAMTSFREFFRTSNPAFFYVPLNPLSVVTTVIIAIAW